MNRTTTSFLAEPDQTEEEYFYEVSDETLKAVAGRRTQTGERRDNFQMWST